jgi:hypothetical protein
MLLSTSSSKLRQTAADRPGVAQPVPLRDIPAQPWNRIAAAALAMLLLMLGAWEWRWRAFGATPSIRNTDALWAIQRRRIDNGEGGATVLVGDSRIFFNLQLPVWERLDGKRPIQLSFEGTSPLRFMEDLAADPKFTGRLLVNIAPVMFFEEFGRHAAALAYYAHESPSQRVGQWLSMRLIEPVVAFDDPEFALAAVIERLPWPDRPGKPMLAEPRKISMLEADRSAHLWSKVETDAEYRAAVRAVWAQRFPLWRVDPPPAKIRQLIQEQTDRAAKAVTKLRARGVSVLFVRMPSDGPFLDVENNLFPRETWDALLTATGAPGIHFEDYPELRDLDLPEWSHLSRADAEQLTESLYRILERDFGGMVTAKEAPISR